MVKDRDKRWQHIRKNTQKTFYKNMHLSHQWGTPDARCGPGKSLSNLRLASSLSDAKIIPANTLLRGSNQEVKYFLNLKA